MEEITKEQLLDADEVAEKLMRIPEKDREKAVLLTRGYVDGLAAAYPEKKEA